MLQSLTTLAVVASTTFAVKNVAPATVEIPLIAPVEELRLSPCGSVPVNENV